MVDEFRVASIAPGVELMLEVEFRRVPVRAIGVDEDTHGDPETD